jgi:hypothetical protein
MRGQMRPSCAHSSLSATWVQAQVCMIICADIILLCLLILLVHASLAPGQVTTTCCCFLEMGQLVMLADCARAIAHVTRGIQPWLWLMGMQP